MRKTYFVIIVIIMLTIHINIVLALELKSSIHTVVVGDNLWKLANKYYQNPLHWEKIYEANKSIIQNSGLIHPGQVLYIPTLWIKHITSGKQFFVIFDKTKDKFDDSIYKGKSSLDPMGNLKGGETYSVSYQNNSFACTGYNQHYKKVGTWIYSNGNPSNSEISLWGRLYKFDIKGNIFDSEYGLVGHISFSKSK